MSDYTLGSDATKWWIRKPANRWIASPPILDRWPSRRFDTFDEAVQYVRERL